VFIINSSAKSNGSTSWDKVNSGSRPFNCTGLLHSCFTPQKDFQLTEKTKSIQTSFFEASILATVTIKSSFNDEMKDTENIFLAKHYYNGLIKYKMG